MITMLQDWNGQVEVNGQLYNRMADVLSQNKSFTGDIHIVLHTTVKRPEITRGNAESGTNTTEQVLITVKKYMTQKSEPGFDFMAKWNNDNPMPLRTMIGTIDKETPGMYHMKLHGDIYAEKICTCMACGRKLTNPVSQYFGIGPECGGHNYVNPFADEEQLKEAVSEYRKKLQNTTWEGWVIKSSILEMEEVE